MALHDQLKTVLVEQATAAPTRKMQGVLVGGGLAGIAASVIGERIMSFGALDAACSEQVAMLGVSVFIAGATWVGSFLSGYFRRESAAATSTLR